MYIISVSSFQMIPVSYGQSELITTLIRMPSIKSQSLRVPSVEEEYACHKREHKWNYFLKLNLENRTKYHEEIIVQDCNSQPNFNSTSENRLEQLPDQMVPSLTKLNTWESNDNSQ